MPGPIFRGIPLNGKKLVLNTGGGLSLVTRGVTRKPKSMGFVSNINAAVQRTVDYARQVAAAAQIRDAQARAAQIQQINQQIEAQRQAQRQAMIRRKQVNPMQASRPITLGIGVGFHPTQFNDQPSDPRARALGMAVAGMYPNSPESPSKEPRSGPGGQTPGEAEAQLAESNRQKKLGQIAAGFAPIERRGPGGQTPGEAAAQKAASDRGRRGGGGNFGGEPVRTQPRIGGPGGQIPGGKDLPERMPKPLDPNGHDEPNLTQFQRDPVGFEWARAQRAGSVGPIDPTISRYMLDEVGATGSATTPFTPETKAKVDGILRDSAISQEEKLRLIGLYRGLSRANAQGMDAERQIQNTAVWHTYRSLVTDANKKSLEGRDVGTMPDGSIFGNLAKDITLQGTGSDNYGPGFIVIDRIDEETGLPWVEIQSRQQANREFAASLRADPAAAAEMKALLVAGGFYAGGNPEKYALDGVVFDGNGNPVAGRWDADDEKPLAEAMDTIQMIQASGDQRSFIEILSELAEQNQQTVSTAATQSGGGGYSGGGGGGGYRRYGGGGGGYGGGGGGGGTGVSYTDSAELKQLINSIARARLGMTLSDAQIQEFVNQYHAQEAAYVNARVAGQSAMQLDPESQAAAWIEGHFRDQMGAQTANSMITALAGFLLGGGTFGSGT